MTLALQEAHREIAALRAHLAAAPADPQPPALEADIPTGSAQNAAAPEDAGPRVAAADVCAKLALKSCTDIGLRILCEIGALLDHHHIRWWIIFGTALGLVRDGQLIKGDSDMDIAFETAK